MIDSKLLSAYRFHRALFFREASRVCGARTALDCARRDVATGKDRYPASYGWNPAFDGGKRWIEKPEQCGLRLVGLAHELQNMRHTGWYVDNDQNETVQGVVYQLPGRHGAPLFVAGYADWNNPGAACIDFSETFEGDKGWIDGRDHAACVDAARAADRMAERAAESERAYQAAWQAGTQWRDLGEQIAADRKKALQLLIERRAAAKSGKGESFNAICAAIRDKVDSILETIGEARQERGKLISGDYVSEWLPGFYTGDKGLCDAFNDGAGETAIPV